MTLQIQHYKQEFSDFEVNSILMSKWNGHKEWNLNVLMLLVGNFEYDCCDFIECRLMGLLYFLSGLKKYLNANLGMQNSYGIFKLLRLYSRKLEFN